MVTPDDDGADDVVAVSQATRVRPARRVRLGPLDSRRRLLKNVAPAGRMPELAEFIPRRDLGDDEREPGDAA